uniref:Sulfatase-modifying factor enzyme-like domain-containing protein n=1 Tax=uncultured bacterium 4050020-J15 TaxID=1343840 RepID=S4W436_9BACT|nr:hypothetical protein [uncultured bacterium 4050020-J15]
MKKKMVLVPAGDFIMGTNKTDNDKTHLKIGAVKPLFLDQHPTRKIFLDTYYIDKYEVTNEEYKKFLDSSGYDELPGHWENGSYAEGKDRYPVTHVTWREALTYSLWAQKSLPTEAQWEKAARGVDGRIYPGEMIMKKENPIWILMGQETWLRLVCTLSILAHIKCMTWVVMLWSGQWTGIKLIRVVLIKIRDTEKH